DSVTAIEHAFSLAVRGCDRAGVEMIAADHDRCLDVAALHQFIDGDAKLGAFAVTEPANPRRQSLVMNSLLRQLHPARERLVFRKQFERELVCARDVNRITTQGDPAKRAAPFAKQWADVFRNEPGNLKRV